MNGYVEVRRRGGLFGCWHPSPLVDVSEVGATGCIHIETFRKTETILPQQIWMLR